MNRRRISRIAAIALAAAFAVPVVGASGGAQADSSYLYVNNASGAGCSDQGTGTEAQPFCTVSAAAAAVQPGQTVLVSAGNYAAFDITRSGTAAAPITFEGAAGALPEIGDGTTAHGILVQGAQHIVVSGFTATGQSDSIAVTDDSANVTLERNRPTRAPIVVSDSTGVVVTTNALSVSAPGGTLSVSESPGTVVTGNTFTGWCSPGVVFDGSSPGAVVENNILDTAQTDPHGNEIACAAGSPDTALTVPTGSTSGTKVAYNFIGNVSGGAAYQWAGKSYSTVAAFAAASGQGSHDILGNTDTLSGFQNAATPAVDSADANAPGELSTDLSGQPRVDVRSVPNTGTGPGYYDRGAYERQTFDAYQPLTPVRVLDTRNATGVSTTTPVAPGGSATITLGTGTVPAVADSVVLNVTVTGGSTAGTLKVTSADPDDVQGSPTPISAVTLTNLTWSKNETISDLVTVPVVSYPNDQLTPNTPITFTNTGKGTVHVVADLQGYYAATAPDGYTTVGPTRILDTRNAIGVTGKKPLGYQSVLSLPVSGEHGVPANARAVVLNVTVTQPTGNGYLTVYPDGQARPGVSSINFSTGQTLPNLVVAPIGADGKVDFYNHSGSAHVIADLEGYFSAQGSSTFDAWGPARILNTTAAGSKALASGASITVTLNNLYGLAGGNPTASVLSLTVLDPTGTGYLNVYPYGTTAPLVSNINWTKGESVTNLVLVPTKSGKIVITNHSTGTVNLYGDLLGEFFND